MNKKKAQRLNCLQTFNTYNDRKKARVIDYPVDDLTHATSHLLHLLQLTLLSFPARQTPNNRLHCTPILAYEHSHSSPPHKCLSRRLPSDKLHSVRLPPPPAGSLHLRCFIPNPLSPSLRHKFAIFPPPPIDFPAYPPYAHS